MDVLAGTQDREWRLLTDSGEDPLRNLAIEEAVARASEGVSTVRVWRNSPCVVLGRFQLLGAEVDERACERLQVPVYRRFTGGGAVYHDLRNLNISLTIPKGHSLVQRDPALSRAPGAYTLLLGPLAKAVASLGFEATFNDRAVFIGERKLSGAAAWFGNDTILVHATLLVATDLEQLEHTLGGPGAPGNSQWERTKSKRAVVTSLVREGLADDAIDSVSLAVIAALAAHFGCVPQSRSLTATEEELAAELLANKYSQLLWHTQGVMNANG